ncbi:MAG: amidase [Deltaproteobacteria bacterium]|nr:amidase [Deltaproteobacteria bacterium]
MTGFQFRTISELADAYRGGRTNPVAIAKKILDAVAEFDANKPPLRAFIAQRSEDVMEMAEASHVRHQKGEPLSLLDGMPIAVKDEIHQKGYPTTVGTSFLGTIPQDQDATVVARLRAAGAILVGKTNMHEVGIGVTGINPHHGPARNPYDLARITGGSSSGSAAAVASGLCPVALGADGGGSIRIPSGLCGVVGLKPTYGRVSEHGAFPLCWSVAHLGPIAGTVADTLEVYRVIAGKDNKDPNTWSQPDPVFSGILDGSLENMTLGVCPEFFNQADDEVVAACRQTIHAMEDLGARTKEVSIAGLAYVRPVQYLTIGVEMAAALYEYRKEDKTRFGADTRVLLQVASSAPAVDYVRAQQLRGRIIAGFDAALAGVDVLVSPTTGRTAAPISAQAAKTGESDEALLESLTEFSFAANLTGLPAVTVPVGYDEQGLPIGFQITAPAWREDLALRCAAAVERTVERQRPQQFIDLLE